MFLVRGMLGTLPAAVGDSSPLEAVFLLRRTGTLIASWSHNDASKDVVSVMAATLYGSVETMVAALGSPSPSTVFIETDLRRMLLARVGAQNVLLLVAERSVTRGVLRSEFQRISGSLSTQEAPMGHAALTVDGVQASVVVPAPVSRPRR